MKNFQLVVQGDHSDGEIALQFGKIGSNEFTMDVRCRPVDRSTAVMQCSVCVCVYVTGGVCGGVSVMGCGGQVPTVPSTGLRDLPHVC